MKKILFVISQLYKGGAESSLVNLINNLDYSKYDIELLILNQEPVTNAVSLIDSVNSHVKVCNAYNEFQKVGILERINAKLIYKMEQKGTYFITALDFVRNKIYDWAFFVGEWYSPSFVAYEVQAKIKAAWIHSDIAKADYFDAELYFHYYDMFDYFVFASKNSMNSSVKKYPFLKDKAAVIYNISNAKNIREKALEKIDDFVFPPKTVVMTCANFRREKNHLRQVEVMAELKKRGIDFIWINVGSTSDVELVNEVKSKCYEKHIENDFIILGPRENPYKYMKKADLITVLSDHESWSMVITEAKVLGVPVVATRTSGALEQIEDEVTGILTEFTKSDIVDKMEKAITDKNLIKRIRDNINNFDNTDEILKSFDDLVENGVNYKKRPVKSFDEKRILYIIDDINYMGGAHISTKLQIKEFIKQKRNISVFSTSIPNIKNREELVGVRFLSWKDFKEDVLYNRCLLDCLTDFRVSKDDKKKKIWLYKKYKKCKDNNFYDTYILPSISRLFSQYDIVCVMSENSGFRRAVAESTCKKKIQWIHIDYFNWKNKTEWNRTITKDDGEIYKKFNIIVVLSENIKENFIRLYPYLKEKVIVNRNMIPVNEIREKAIPNNINGSVKFVTVGRIDYQKAYPRLIRVLGKLKEKGYDFRWSIVGGGDEFWNIKKMIDNAGLTGLVDMKGELDNPFIEMKNADVFALLSDFEGLPNTIFEALILGIPVLATNVGAVATQIEDGVTGWLVDNDEEEIYRGIENILLNKKMIINIKKNICNYSYNNKEIIDINTNIFQ